MDDYVRLLDVVDITKRAGVYSIIAKELYDLEGLDIQPLIEKINEPEFIHHNGYHYWYMTVPEIKKEITKIIKDYFGIAY